MAGIDDILGAMQVNDEAPEMEDTPVEESQPEEQQAEPEQIEQAPEVKEGEPKEERTRYVPHAALHEAREKQKELRQMLEREQAARAELEQKINAFTSQQQAPQEPQDYFTQQESEISQLKQMVQEMTEQQRRAYQEQQFISRYRESAAAFEKDKPDFKDAYNFLLQNRRAEYEVFGYPKEQIDAALLQDERKIVETAYSVDKSPAEVLYSLAMQRGYKAQQPVSLEQKEGALRAAKSLGSSGAPADTGAFDPDNLHRLSPKEFEKLWKEREKKGLL